MFSYLDSYISVVQSFFIRLNWLAFVFDISLVKFGFLHHLNFSDHADCKISGPILGDPCKHTQKSPCQLGFLMMISVVAEK